MDVYVHVVFCKVVLNKWLISVAVTIRKCQELRLTVSRTTYSQYHV